MHVTGSDDDFVHQYIFENPAYLGSWIIFTTGRIALAVITGVAVLVPYISVKSLQIIWR